MPEKQNSMEDPDCKGCDYQKLPKDSGFCYMFKEKPVNCMVGKNRHKQPKKSIAATLVLVSTVFGRMP